MAVKVLVATLVTLVLEDILFWFPGELGIHMVARHMCRQNAYRYIKKKIT